MENVLKLLPEIDPPGRIYLMRSDTADKVYAAKRSGKIVSCLNTARSRQAGR